MTDRAVPQLDAIANLKDEHQLVVWTGQTLGRVTVAQLAQHLVPSPEPEPEQPPAETYTHWRVRRIESQHSYHVAIGSLVFPEAPAGGTNLFSTQYSDTTFSAAWGWNADPSQPWQTEYGAVADAYLGRAYAEAFDLATLSITAGSGLGMYYRCPTAFAVDASNDGATWNEAWRIPDLPQWSAGETRTFTRPA